MEFTLQSGAKLIVTASSFQDAQTLTKALLKSVKGLDITEDIMKTDIKAFFDGLIAVSTSDEVEKALFKCAERATYDSVKVTKDLFDDLKLGEQARTDYYEICKDLIEVNCLPFFKKAFSLFKTATVKQANNIPG